MMKLPNGNPQPPVSPSPTREGPAARNTTPGDAGQTSPARTAAQLLDGLELGNRQAVIARVAQVLQAAGEQPQQALLDVKGRSLLVDLPMLEPRIQSGDLLRIMRAGQELQLLEKLAAPAEARLAQALARHLPGQHRLDSGLNQLINSLSTGVRPTPGSAALPGTVEPLPAAAREAIQGLLRQVPSGTGFTSPGAGAGTETTSNPVRQWIASSGLFTEAHLGQQREPAVADLKLALGRIITSLLQHQGLDQAQFSRYTPLPSQDLMAAPLQFPVTAAASGNAGPAPEPMSTGQMLRLLAGMLNRITVNQLHSQLLSTRTAAEAPAGATSTWLVDLPWLSPQGDARIAQLRLEQHDAGDDSGSNQPQRQGVSEWRFSLALDLDTAGPVFFEVALREAAVSARVWAERQGTLQQVRQHLDGLRDRLTELGLEVTGLECRRGSPQGATTRLEHQLIDIRA